MGATVTGVPLRANDDETNACREFALEAQDGYLVVMPSMNNMGTVA